MKAAAVSIVAATLIWSGLQSIASARPPENGVHGKRVTVPAVKAARVITDGTFAPGEWDDALRQPLGDNFELYLLADSANLYVGFKYLKDVESTPLSEVYVATSDKEFLNLHSSGSLGEGVNHFPPEGGQAKYAVGNATGWESNFARLPAHIQGKEYKISRTKLPGPTVRLAGVMMVVNYTMRESVRFPKDHGFSGPEKWAELVLPPVK